MALIEDTGDQNLQELDRRISRIAQVCRSAAADTVIIMLNPATAFDVCTPFAKGLLCAPSNFVWN